MPISGHNFPPRIKECFLALYQYVQCYISCGDNPVPPVPERDEEVCEEYKVM
jgi:hypothetical protein